MSQFLCSLVLVVSFLICPFAHAQTPEVKKVRLFILSGQSNMQNLRPEISFTPAVTTAFPNDDVIVVKDAQSGQPIRRWLKDWKPGPGAPKIKDKLGDLYERLLASVAKAMEGKPAPTSVIFVWMQGEADAKGDWCADVYEASLKQLIANLRTDMKAPAMPVVLGRLSDFSTPILPAWDKVRQAQEAVAKSDPLVTWVDCDDLNGPKNGLHYTGDGYRLLGERFATNAIAAVPKN